MKRAFITGVTGQDGSYLTEFLLGKGYQVHGLVSNLEAVASTEGLVLHKGSLEERKSLEKALSAAAPDEIYNFGAVSHEQTALRFPESAANVNAFGVLRLLEIVKASYPAARFFQASSAELFGHAHESPQTEETPFRPYSPYGVAKLYAHWTVVNYRNMHGLYAVNGILFNHESPRRKESFVSRKISRAVARIHRGLQTKLILGNLHAERDWGFAKDFVEAIWKMVQQPRPEDFVIASGEIHSIREFVEIAFETVGISLVWEGEGVHEKGRDRRTDQVVVEVSSDLFRPVEVQSRLGNASKARTLLDWTPQTKFRDLVTLMVQHDLKECL